MGNCTCRPTISCSQRRHGIIHT